MGTKQPSQPTSSSGTSAVERELCLVLGGNGFIGSHIVDKLVASGNMRVRVLDPFFRPPQFHPSKFVSKVTGDAFDPATLDRALKGVTYVVHSLAATNPFTADTDPYADIENLKRSVEIFEHCVRAGVKKVAFISSGGAVYGQLAEQKVATEGDIPMPVSPYGICKLATEHYMEYFKRKYGIEYVVYRLSNPYGPRQAFKKEQGVIPAFLRRILDNEEITILGDGTASRDYIYIEDAAAMIADSLPKQNKYSVYNIGSGHQTALNEIITALERIFGKKVPTTYMEAPRTTLQKTDISIDRFREDFGNLSITNFDQGLSKTVHSFEPEQSAT